MKGWGWMLGLGLAVLAMGVLALGNAVVATVAVTVATGVMFLIAGGMQVFGGFAIEQAGARIVSVLIGMIMVFLGWSFLAHPLQGALSLTFLVMMLFAMTGILRIVYAWRMRETSFFWPMLLSGAASVLLAGYILSVFNLSGVEAGDAGLDAAAFEPVLSVLGLLLGIELSFNGIGMVVLALFLRNGPTPR